MKRTAKALLVASLLLLGCARGPNDATAESAADATTDDRASAMLIERARDYASSGDYTRAEQYLNLAAQSGQDGEELTPLLIDVCVKDQRYRAALQYAEEHLRRHPRAYRLRYVAATLLAAVGDVARAREELEQVLAVDPKHADAHFTLAVMLRDDLGNHLEADRHFRDYLMLAPSGVHAEEASQSLLEAMP